MGPGGFICHIMWKGRFQTETSDLVQMYGESISYDWRLYRYDVEGSIAHAKALAAAGLITAKEKQLKTTVLLTGNLAKVQAMLRANFLLLA